MKLKEVIDNLPTYDRWVGDWGNGRHRSLIEILQSNLPDGPIEMDSSDLYALLGLIDQDITERIEALADRMGQREA
jgi:hypothetical protein